MMFPLNPFKVIVGMVPLLHTDTADPVAVPATGAGLTVIVTGNNEVHAEHDEFVART